ncbi:Hypothetical predicted protein [Marmota monax]|uniref:Uncharacterized protein n=1 Tax=Marmota monax TaxID=9995 RepID=A0A5E4AIR1_MARMO|nr:Hypothetical predicted protein [Marmota monax]
MRPASSQPSQSRNTRKIPLALTRDRPWFPPLPAHAAHSSGTPGSHLTAHTASRHPPPHGSSLSLITPQLRSRLNRELAGASLLFYLYSAGPSRTLVEQDLQDPDPCRHTSEPCDLASISVPLGKL